MIAMQLLDRVHATELLTDQVMNHVEPFVKKHGLSLCHVLTDYCKEVMDGGANKTKNSNNWQSRVLTLLNLVRDPSFKAMLLLDAMRRSPIPWSSEMEKQILSVAAKVNPKLKEEINEQFKLMKLKLMVQKYGVKNFNVSDMNLASRLIPFILRHVEINDAIGDAIQCLRTFHIGSNHEIVVLRCQNLITSGKVEQLESLLMSGKEDASQMSVDYLDVVNKPSVCGELETWISLKLERMYQRDKGIEQMVTFLRSGAIVASTLSEADPEKYPRNRRYEKCLTLFHDFGIKMVPSLLEDNEFVENLLNRAIEDGFTLNTSEMMNRAYRIGDLLEFDRSELLWKAAHFLAKRFRYNDTLTTCQELTEKFAGSATSKMISQLIDTFLNHPVNVFLEESNVTSITSVLVEMSRIAVRKSVAEELELHLRTFKRMELFHRMALRTDKGAYQESVSSIERIKQSVSFQGLFRNQHQEIGLVMASSRAIPLILKFILDLRKSETIVGGKGKGKDSSADFLESSQELLELCLSTRNFENCIRVVQLTLEQCLSRNISIPDRLSETNSNALSFMLQNVIRTNADAKCSRYRL
jgi:hypothetical protein